MSTHTRLLFLGLLASLGGAGQAEDSPFLLGSDSELQVAVRVISDERKESSSTNDEPEGVVRPELPPADSEAEDQKTAKKPEKDADSTNVPTEASSGTSILDWLQILLGLEKDPEPAGQKPADESKEASALPDETGNEDREPAGRLDKNTASEKASSEAEAESGPRVSEQGAEDKSREAPAPTEESASGGEQPPEPSHTPSTSPPGNDFLDWLSALFETNEDSDSASQTPARESEADSASSGETEEKGNLPTGQAREHADSDEPSIAKREEKGSGEAGQKSADRSKEASTPAGDPGSGGEDGEPARQSAQEAGSSRASVAAPASEGATSADATSADGPEKTSSSSEQAGNKGDLSTGQTDGKADSDRPGIAKREEKGPGETGQESADGSKEASTPAGDPGPSGEDGGPARQSAQEAGPSRTPVAAPSGEGAFDWLSILFGTDEDSAPADAASADGSKEATTSSEQAGDKGDLPAGQIDEKADSDELVLGQETGKGAKPAGKPSADGAGEATAPSAETRNRASQSAGQMGEEAVSDGADAVLKPGKTPGATEQGSASGPKSASIPSGNAGRTAAPDMSGAAEKPGKASKPAEQASSGELEGGSVASGEAGSKSGQSAVQTPGMPGLGQLGVIGATVGEPGLAGQASRGETREMILSRAEAVLNRVDQILLDARARARQEQGGRGDNGGTMLENDSPTGRTQDGSEGEFVEEGAEHGGLAEGQVPGNVPTGKAHPTHGYEEDDDIVTRQVCELAEREKDPEVRKQLEKKCKSLRDS